MIVRISFHPPYSNIVKKSYVSIALDRGSTVETLLRKLASELPELAKFIMSGEDFSHNFALTRERELLRLDSQLKDGDEVKIFGPLSGGR